MARTLYGASPADYVINGTTGLPASGVSLDVYDAAGGSPIIDLKGVSGTTYGEGSTVTSLTSNSIGMYPFYGPDGTTGTLYLRAADGVGGFLWYGVNPTNLGNLVATLSGTVATLASTIGGSSDWLGNVSSDTAMLALTGQIGDWCTRTDTSTTWQLWQLPATVLGNWKMHLTPTATSLITSFANALGGTIRVKIEKQTGGTWSGSRPTASTDVSFECVAPASVTKPTWLVAGLDTYDLTPEA